MKPAPDYGPFGAASDTGAAAQAALAALVPEGGELWLVEGEAWPLPPGLSPICRNSAFVPHAAAFPVHPATSALLVDIYGIVLHNNSITLF